MNIFEAMRFDYHHKVFIYNDNLQTLWALRVKFFNIIIKLQHVNIVQMRLRQFDKVRHLNVAYKLIQFMIADELTKILISQRHAAWIKNCSVWWILLTSSTRFEMKRIRISRFNWLVNWQKTLDWWKKKLIDFLFFIQACFDMKIKLHKLLRNLRECLKRH